MPGVMQDMRQETPPGQTDAPDERVPQGAQPVTPDRPRIQVRGDTG